jgi:hypothetical protein
LHLLSSAQEILNSISGTYLLNSEQTGFYRVHYDRDNTDAIATVRIG